MVKKCWLIIPLLFISACGPATASIELLGQLNNAQTTQTVGITSVVEGDSHMYLLEPMIRYAESIGVSVQRIGKFKVNDEWVAGGFSRKTKTIFLDVDQPPNMQVATFAHELGHALAPSHLRPKTPGAEVFAEVVSCLVMRAFGLDVTRESFAYITYSQSDGIFAMQLYGQEIDLAVAAIVAGIKQESGY